jgi:hypothetical protein
MSANAEAPGGGRTLGEAIATSLGEKRVAPNIGAEGLPGLKSPRIAGMTDEAFERLQSGLTGLAKDVLDPIQAVSMPGILNGLRSYSEIALEAMDRRQAALDRIAEAEWAIAEPQTYELLPGPEVAAMEAVEKVTRDVSTASPTSSVRSSCRRRSRSTRRSRTPQPLRGSSA